MMYGNMTVVKDDIFDLDNITIRKGTNPLDNLSRQYKIY